MRCGPSCQGNRSCLQPSPVRRTRFLLPEVPERPLARRQQQLRDGQPVHLFNDQVLRDPLNFSTPWGESFLQQMERLRSLLDELHARHPEGRIIAVSHENPIIAALALTVPDPAEVVLQGLPNCGRLDLHWPVHN